MDYRAKVVTFLGDDLLFLEHPVVNIQDNILMYETENDQILINLDDFCFRRENAECILIITKDKCLLEVKELGRNLEIPINYVNFEYTNKNVMVEYLIESNDKPIKIEIEMRIDDER